MNSPKFIFFIILVCALRGVGGFAQTAKTVSTPKRYNVLVKYNIELIATGNIYREREIKTNGVNRSSDEHLQHWGNTKTLFSTQGALIANNFELYKDTETGIISISSTDNTKVTTRKKDGVVGKTTGRHEVMDLDKNVFQEWVSTKNDIAHNEGYNREFVCKKHHTILGEGNTPVKVEEGGSSNIQMRYNPKNRRVEIRNWLPDFDLNITGVEGFTSTGDKNCNNSLNTSQDASELVSQFSLGLGQMLKNSIIYNSKEGIGDQMREVPYIDIQNLGQFAGFRFSNQSINVLAAETENRYIFDMSFKDSFQETPVNITSNPDPGAFYRREFEGKEFKIKASVMIVFQQKDIKFDDYPGEELPSEDPEHRDLGWVPLMDKDDYLPTPKDKARIITILTQFTDNEDHYFAKANTPIESVSKVNGIEKKAQLTADQGGKIVFDANQLLADKWKKETISFSAPFLMQPQSVANVPLFGPDTTIYFNQPFRNITLRMQEKATKRGIAGQGFMMYNEEARDSLTLFKSGADGNVLISRHWTFNLSRPNTRNVVQVSVDSNFVPSIVRNVPTYGGDTTIVFEKISSINRSTIIGSFKSIIDTETQALPSINVKIEQTGDNNIVQTFPRRVEVVVAQEFNHQTAKVGEVNIVPQPPANLKVYPPYQTITVPRGENEIRLPLFLVLPRNTPVYKVTGIVKTPRGVPASGAEVGLNAYTVAITDAQGKFTVYVPAGTYSLSVPDSQEQEVAITVVNQDLIVNFTLK